MIEIALPSVPLAPVKYASLSSELHRAGITCCRRPGASSLGCGAWFLDRIKRILTEIRDYFRLKLGKWAIFKNAR